MKTKNFQLFIVKELYENDLRKKYQIIGKYSFGIIDEYDIHFITYLDYKILDTGITVGNSDNDGAGI